MLDALREFNMPSVLLRLTLAVLCGGMIGVNREHKRRPAGFRTYMLVCLGSAMTGVLSQYLWMMMNTQWAEVSALLEKKIDVSRIGAKAIGGVGFLGAGTILITDQSEVKGLTTAAGLWVVAIVGLCCGFGFYEGAVYTTILVLVAEVFFSKLEYRLLRSNREIGVYVEYTKPSCLEEVVDRCHMLGVKIVDLEINRKNDETGASCAVLALSSRQGAGREEIFQALTSVDDVLAVVET